MDGTYYPRYYTEHEWNDIGCTMQLSHASRGLERALGITCVFRVIMHYHVPKVIASFAFLPVQHRGRLYSLFHFYQDALCFFVNHMDVCGFNFLEASTRRSSTSLITFLSFAT